jgi:hypothetical protein
MQRLNQQQLQMQQRQMEQLNQQRQQANAPQVRPAPPHTSPPRPGHAPLDDNNPAQRLAEFQQMRTQLARNQAQNRLRLLQLQQQENLAAQRELLQREDGLAERILGDMNARMGELEQMREEAHRRARLGQLP